MSQRRRLDIVTPPFGGHLHPQLDLGSRVRDATDWHVHLISTPSAAQAIELCQLPYTLVLGERERIITDIANAPHPVGSRPWRLLQQLRDNVSLMDRLTEELSERWQQHRPDLVIADFAVPVAGLLAERMGIPWWTAIRAPTVIDTPDGVPPYMGGLHPRHDWVGNIRDRLARGLVRTFKRSAHFIFRRSLRRWGIPTVYRDDGYERIYSPRRILIQGIREFEFECTWPPSARFIGPLTASPPFPHHPPRFTPGKPHVLVSLGTHVRWAQEKATHLIRSLAARLPDLEFHFTRGALHSHASNSQENYQEVAYLPYDQYLMRYAASINHAGAGIMYSCLRHGIPSLAWPQDFDQFDNTARIVHHRLGLQCRPKIELLCSDLKQLLSDTALRQRCLKMQASIQSYDTTALIAHMLDEFSRELE